MTDPVTVQTNAPDRPRARARARAREKRTAWTVWGVLAAVTAIGAIVTESGGGGKVIVALIALFGIAKCWLIVQYFMEVRHAPRWLQVVTTAWMVVLWLTLTVLFLRA